MNTGFDQKKIHVGLFSKLKRLHHIYLRLKKQPSEYLQWLKKNGDFTLRFNYPLKEDSVVFDVGGYHGDWCDNIVRLYDPVVYVFEPVPKFYSKIKARFRDNHKVLVHNFGLGDQDKKERLGIKQDSSSTFGNARHFIDIDIVDIVTFIENSRIEKIDLIKINIEGGEYALLKRMGEANLLRICRDIQIQFHDVVQNAECQRDEIRAMLARTHYTTYDFPFVWENWRLRPS